VDTVPVECVESVGRGRDGTVSIDSGEERCRWVGMGGLRGLYRWWDGTGVGAELGFRGRMGDCEVGAHCLQQVGPLVADMTACKLHQPLQTLCSE
jgi:hypothetical protein